MTRAERAQMAMMLEVCAYPKPGNVDRCHDYESTYLEHFLSSMILVRPALEKAERAETGIGDCIYDAVARTNTHSGGNTHFGAFLLIIPLVRGGDIPAAAASLRSTSVDDAISFYRAFGMTRVRVLSSDELDVNDPAALEQIRKRGLTLFDIMVHSGENDMVAREWTNGFSRTRRGADLLKANGPGRGSIVRSFIDLLSEEPDTFIAKEHGKDAAEQVRQGAAEVASGRKDIGAFDQECIDAGINPGSTADILIASLFVAMGEGWQWDF
jgi:triphosphoribosyl-dephospho-CoA synthase